MSYVELGIPELSRMLSIMSSYFGKKEMTVDDIKLRKKLEAMHRAEVEWSEE